jgi:hypothetical protein
MATEEQHQQDMVDDAAVIQVAEDSATVPLPVAAPAEFSGDQQPDSALTAAAADAAPDEAAPAPVHEPDAQLKQQQSRAINRLPAAVGVAADVVAAADPTASLLQVISFNAAKRNNLHLLDDDTLLMSVGCMVLLLHLPTMKQRWLPGRDGGGVAAVAVHPSKQHFLVAERCKSRPPNM